MAWWLDDELWSVEYKTGKEAYPETAMQLAALNRADWAGKPGDPKKYRIPKATRFGVLWIRPEAAELILKGVANTIANKELTYDLARLREAIRAPKRELAGRKNVEEDLQRLIPGAKLMTTSGFGEAVIRHMDD